MSTEAELRKYVEEFALFLENQGLPRPSGRILGWLLVCEPPQQSMPELVDALGVSKSSVSTATRMLMQAGLVERISLPGERRDYYRMTDDAFSRAMEARTAQIQALRQLAESGLALLANTSAARRERLLDMRDMYAFFEAEMEPLMARWRNQRARRQEHSE